MNRAKLPGGQRPAGDQCVPGRLFRRRLGQRRAVGRRLRSSLRSSLDRGVRRAGRRRRVELFVYNWSDYIAPANIDAFKAEFGVDNFVYDVFANNEELIAKLQGGASGYDICCPTAEYVPGMVEEGFITSSTCRASPTPPR